MSTVTKLTVHAPAWSQRGSRQFTYPMAACDALDALIAEEFPGTRIVPAGLTIYLVGTDGRTVGDVDIEVIA